MATALSLGGLKTFWRSTVSSNNSSVRRGGCGRDHHRLEKPTAAYARRRFERRPVLASQSRTEGRAVAIRTRQLPQLHSRRDEFCALARVIRFARRAALVSAMPRLHHCLVNVAFCRGLNPDRTL